jgi:hypothetical protein
MKPIRDATRVEHYGVLLREMMLAEEGQECEFSPDWVRNHGWRVVPTESMARIPVPDIPRIVSTLTRAGYTECIAIFSEPGYIRHLPLTIASDPPSEMATCHLVSVDEADFQNFNRELGRFVLCCCLKIALGLSRVTSGTTYSVPSRSSWRRYLVNRLSRRGGSLLNSPLRWRGEMPTKPFSELRSTTLLFKNPD